MKSERSWGRLDLKSKWRECTIGDLCDSISETYKRNDDEVILINTSDVLDGSVLNHTPVLNYKLKGQFKKTFRKNDILYSEIRPANKRYAFIDIDNTDKYIASTKLMVLRPRTDIILPEFLFAILTSKNVVDELQHLAETRSGTFPQITFSSELAPMEIMLPDFTTQYQIVSLLTSIEGKIKINTAINENLEQQAQAIFKSWFVDFEPFGGVMPDDWNTGNLGSFVTIKRGGSPRPIQNYLSETGYRWLKISDVTSLNSPFILDIKEHIIESGLKKTVFLKQGALVLSNSATPGIPKILDVDSCIHDGWLYFPESKFSNEYLYLLFKFIRKDLVALGNGSVFTNLKTDILKQYEISLPSERVLNDFQTVISPLFETMRNIARENKSLAALRDTLLPKLMNGEIDVSQVQI